MSNTKKPKKSTDLRRFKPLSAELKARRVETEASHQLLSNMIASGILKDRSDLLNRAENICLHIDATNKMYNQ